MKHLLLLALLALSAAYNASLPRWPSTLPGLTAIQVALGVAYTLPVAAWLAGPRRTFPRRLAWLLAAFIAAGAPMLAGDFRRDRRLR